MIHYSDTEMPGLIVHNDSIITYGIIFWGNSTGSDEVFKLQKGLLELLQTHTAVPHVVTYLKN